MSNSAFKQKLGLIATSLRIVLAPFVLLGVYIPENDSLKYVCAILFIIGSITDGLDGYWARKYNGVTDFGKFYDPAADKVIVLAALLTLLSLGRVGPILVFLLLSRDFIIGAVRSAAASKGIVIDAKQIGKWKTAIQMVCIPVLFININYFNLPLIKLAYLGLWASVVLSLVSAAEYIMLFKKGKEKANP